ncbi:uncharacterized protein FIBRA_07725 [Fibroporia radiculosa]|uniref:F-box domain-containing protein n=1 Tax=Fibroporia radiculosa TaxID=599839 RepID=J4I182_9APHY|nr:uncharacterized protein FIBRA_07725 [Fibroporia radiculosa]CCM05502.1 predicted protein [Fibroporia radiculosa]
MRDETTRDIRKPPSSSAFWSFLAAQGASPFANGGFFAKPCIPDGPHSLLAPVLTVSTLSGHTPKTSDVRLIALRGALTNDQPPKPIQVEEVRLCISPTHLSLHKATLPMDVVLTYSPQDAHSVTDRDEVEDVATVGAEWNVLRSCWDASIAERTLSQLCDICLVVSSRLPTELWEWIIDFIADDDEDNYYMQQLGQVCRGWYARCRFRSHETLYVRRMDKKQIHRLIGTLEEHPDRCRNTKGVLFELEYESIGLFGSFAVRMVQKLPRVELLRFGYCTWNTGQLHAQIFLHITLTFGSVTKLELFDVNFPSAVVFGRLVRALPRLSSLACHSVQFKNGCHVAGAVRVPGSLRLDAADLNDSDDVFDVLVSAGTHLRHLSCYGSDLEKHSDLLAVSAESLSSLEVWLLRRVPSVNLTAAVNLGVLSLACNLEDIATAASVLSRASLPKLVEVVIRLWLHYLERPVSIQDTLNSVDNDCFVQMDRILSGKQFPTLGKVTFLLRYVGLETVKEAMDVIPEGSLGTLLASKLPALHASGRLLTSVTVNIDTLRSQVW